MNLDLLGLIAVLYVVGGVGVAVCWGDTLLSDKLLARMALLWPLLGWSYIGVFLVLWLHSLGSPLRKLIEVAELPKLREPAKPAEGQLAITDDNQTGALSAPEETT